MLLLLQLHATAQQDSINRKPAFKIGTFYNSNLHYFGRTDSLRSSAVFPVAEFWITPSFYVNAAPVFVHNSVQGLSYAGTVSTAGIQINREKMLAHLYFTKPFYRDNSQLPQSVLKAQAATSFTWKNKYVNVTTGADLKFSNQTDIGATLGLDHIIRRELKGPAVLVIDPSVYLYAGTQRFTKTWQEKSNFLFLEGPEREYSKAVSQFTVLSYELSIPIVYAKGKWMVLATPAFVMPQNLVKVPEQPEMSETGRNLFYITLGAKVTL